MPPVPLVFLHGWCGDPGSWVTIPAAFIAEREVHVPALTYDGSLPEIPEACVLIGHSMGGTLARRLVRHKPRNVRAVAFVDGHLPKHKPDAARREAFLQAFRSDYAKAASDYIDSLSGPESPAWIKPAMLSKPADVAIRALEFLDDADVWAWQGTDEDRIECPALALWAQPSPMARVGEDHEAWMRQWCRELRYEAWPGASHFLHLEHQQRFEALLRRFLEDCGL